MDIEQSPSGRIIKSPTGYKAFIPEALPPKLEWDDALVYSLSRADFLLGKLVREGSRLPNPHLLLRPFILHFAIHPIENFDNEEPGTGAIKLAFEVFDITSFVEHLKSKGVEVLYPPKVMGPMLITAVKDPDGNHVEFTQLGERWIKRLEKRSGEGHCIVQAWKKTSADLN